MRSLAKLAVVVLCVVAVAGCATYDGSMALKGKNQADVEAMLQKNQTSKTEVKEKFGEPTSSSTGDKNWWYTLHIAPNPNMLYVPFSSYFMPARGKKEVAIEFNNNEVVDNFNFEDTTK